MRKIYLKQLFVLTIFMSLLFGVATIVQATDLFIDGTGDFTVEFDSCDEELPFTSDIDADSVVEPAVELLDAAGEDPEAAPEQEVEPIYTVEINNVSFPKEGGEPDYYVSVPDGMGYYIKEDPKNSNQQNGVIWSECISLVESRVLQPGEGIFEAGKQYSISVVIAEDEGYAFPRNDDGMYLVNAYINGIPAEVSIFNIDGKQYLSVSLLFAVQEEYDLIIEGGEAYLDRSNTPTEAEWEPIDSAPAGTYVNVKAEQIEGWEFDHWEVLEGKIENFVDRSSTFFQMPACDVRMRAYYRSLDGEQITYFHNVILCFGDSPIAGYSVPHGGTAVEPEDPGQEGMVFLGWYTKDGQKYDFSAPVTADVILTAKFEAAECETHTWGRGIAETRATTTAPGKMKYTCTVCGKTKTNTIYKASGVKLSAATYTYDGKIKNPTVIVKDSRGNTISSANYTISRPTGRKNVGQYTYKITFKNHYSGTKNLTFKINPRGTSISRLASASKALGVTWKKQSVKMAASRITGYQVQYSTNKRFTNAKTKTVAGYGVTSSKISGLRAKTTYYVRVRTYKTIKMNGKSMKFYSGWSSVKSIKTK